MSKPKLHVYIPGLSRKPYEYRRGDSILIYDDDKHAILIDGGESDLFDKMESFLKKNFTGSDGYAHVTFVLTHWHGDHDCGLKSALESPHIFVDEIFCPPPEELKDVPRDDGYDEYSRAKRRLALAADYNKKVIYPASGRRCGHWVGKIRMWMWRQAANRGDYVDYQVNNTSIQTYFPDLEFLAGGDMINSERYLKKYPSYRITGFKIHHHGNAESYSTCDLLTEHGAKICYYTDWEPSGVSIGGTTFSKYGAGRCKQYFEILRPFEDITIDADGEGHVTWTQGGKSWTYDINYGRSEPLPEPGEEPAEEPTKSIVDYTKLSPNNSGTRTHAIDRITPHCAVGQLSVETFGSMFANTSKEASCNYAIGSDGRVALIVEESKRSWCSSSSANDQRAITIECASDATAPYAFNDMVYNKLIDLCVDICRRYGKTKLLWISDKSTALAYEPKADEMLFTVHRWFANKSCPGDWMMQRMGDLAEKVTARLAGAPAPVNQIYRVRMTWEDAASQLGAFSSLDNARAMAAKHPGWHVFDSSGNEM